VMDDKGLASDRNQRFGRVVGKRAESLAIPC